MLLRTAVRTQDLTPAAERRLDIDLMRALALAVVVAGHLLMGLVAWEPAAPVLGNLLAGDLRLQAITWVLQVMPVFFLAGGAANLMSWRSAQRKGTEYQDWLWARASRLLAPTLCYLAIVVPVASVISRITPAGYAAPLLSLTTQLLWFLSIYLVITALTPLLAAGHDRRPLASLFGWLALVGLAEALRFGADLPAAALLSFVTGWAFVAQLGFRLLSPQLPRGRALALGATVIAANAMLVGLGPFPISLVGMPGDAISNMAPPSIVLLGHSVVFWVALDALRPGLQRLAARPRLWRWTVSMNLAAMTVYLWHLPAIVSATTILHLLGWDRPMVLVDGLVTPGDGFWPASIPLFALSAVLIYAAVQTLWGLEQLRLPAPRRRWLRRAARPAAATGAGVGGIGLLLLSAVGPADFPVGRMEFSGLAWTNAVAAVVTLGGLAVLWVASGRERSAERQNGRQSH